MINVKENAWFDEQEMSYSWSNQCQWTEVDAERVADCLWIRRQKETAAAKDREIVSLRRQLDVSSDELAEVGRGREIALRENRRIQEDVALMTRENQVSAISPANQTHSVIAEFCRFKPKNGML